MSDVFVLHFNEIYKNVKYIIMIIRWFNMFSHVVFGALDKSVIFQHIVITFMYYYLVPLLCTGFNYFVSLIARLPIYLIQICITSWSIFYFFKSLCWYIYITHTHTIFFCHNKHLFRLEKCQCRYSWYNLHLHVNNLHL